MTSYNFTTIDGTYTNANRSDNETIGASNLAITQNDSGRMLALTNPNTVEFDSSGKGVDTGLKPSLEEMTIYEVVVGLLEDLNSSGVSLGTQSQREELRVWKTDGTYKINNTLQGYTPTAPAPDTVMVLDETACIGYPDSVDRTKCKFKVITEATTNAEDTAEYNDYTNCNGS